MEGSFKEFDNENALRAYPFAAGCALPSEGGVAITPNLLVDAALYPVNPSGIVYLSGVSKDGKFSVSDDSGVIMAGEASGDSVELFDASDGERHMGTLVAYSHEALSDFVSFGTDRVYTKEQTAFAASCVFPVVVDGVSGLSVGGTGRISGNLLFANGRSDTIRVSSGIQGGRRTLRFDVLPRPSPPDLNSIKRITCVVDGKTPFRISRSGGINNVVALSLYGIDRAAVCGAAHREDSFEMSDTCGCEKNIPSGRTLPDTYQSISVDIPYVSHNAFFLVVPDAMGYDNPLSLTLEDGAVSPKTEDPKVVVDGLSAEIAEGEMLDQVSSKAVVLQVPGLSGGAI